MKLPWLVAAAVLTSASVSHAYTHVVVPLGREYVALRWPSAAQPIRFGLNEETGPSLPNVLPGSDPVGAIERALTKWPAVADVQLELYSTSVASAGADGVNVISFAATAANARVLEMSGDPLALTLFFFDDARITEADVVFSPERQFSTTAGSQAELRDTGSFDVEGIATHELGHAIGLQHSGVESATMWAFSSLFQRHPDADDIASVEALYPHSGNDNGAIVGTVRVGTRAAFAAHVVAVAADGRLYSGLTRPNGTYSVRQVPAGDYQIYVEPLDGPHSGRPLDGCIQFGNMAGAGIYNSAMLTTNFRTTFHDSGSVSLAPDETLQIDFNLAAAVPALNPVQIGGATAESMESRLAGIPLDVPAGGDQWIAVGGPGMDQVESISVLGSGVDVDVGSRRLMTATCDEREFPVIVFRTTIAADAVPGGRTIVVATAESNEIAAFTGAFRIHGMTGTPTPTPTATPSPTPRPPAPCVGDCDSDDAVEVNELVLGVRINLELESLAACSDFDTNGDERVAVNELVQSVNALLGGCIADAAR